MIAEMSQKTMFGRFFQEVVKHDLPNITIGNISRRELPTVSISHIIKCEVYASKAADAWQFKMLLIVYDNDYVFRTMYTEDEPEYPHLEAICGRVNVWLGTYRVLMI